MGWYVCNECDYMNLNDRNKYNEAWCSYFRKYFSPAEKACYKLKNNGRELGRENACYLTTTMCDILGQQDHGFVLETLRQFRNNYMRGNEEYTSLLKEYDMIGPLISKELIDDEQQRVIANTMLYLRLYPAIEAINNKDYKKAIEIYKDMTLLLKERYNISDEQIIRQRKID